MKIPALLLAICLMLPLAACGGTAQPDSSSAPDASVSQPPQNSEPSASEPPASDSAASEPESEATAPRFESPSPELLEEAAAKYALFESIELGMTLEQVEEILGEYDYGIKYATFSQTDRAFYYENSKDRPACSIEINEERGVTQVRLNIRDNMDWLPAVIEPIPNEELEDFDNIVTQTERGLLFWWRDNYGALTERFIFFNTSGDFAQDFMANAVLEWDYWMDEGNTLKEEYERNLTTEYAEKLLDEES